MPPCINHVNCDFVKYLLWKVYSKYWYYITGRSDPAIGWNRLACRAEMCMIDTADGNRIFENGLMNWKYQLCSYFAWFSWWSGHQIIGWVRTTGLYQLVALTSIDCYGHFWFGHCTILIVCLRTHYVYIYIGLYIYILFVPSLDVPCSLLYSVLVFLLPFLFIFFLLLCNFAYNLILLCCLWATDFPPWANKGISICLFLPLCRVQTRFKTSRDARAHWRACTRTGARAWMCVHARASVRAHTSKSSTTTLIKTPKENIETEPRWMLGSWWDS